ncbi:FprA family A-type flavoprotein [Desulfurella sp.]|uniref:FprA family A-type flavoprotein n=1 Tax=Desulfurella sp. TaxID=1962857 RepID=UPI0025BA7BCA|nr:FprA family A-type flavoprotein [Desulfurella sp.]
MAVQKVDEDVYYVGSRHWDRPIFDELLELPKGTSYNSYLISGSQKTALIDSVDPCKKHELLRNLDILNVKNIDYIIANHAEQDHSGSIPAVLERYPQAKVVTNEKCKSLLIDLLDINEDRFMIINDNDTLSLGDKTLQFVFTPWVHWPETMSVYLVEKKMLFTCDFFGSHIATSKIFGPKDEKLVYEGAKRYYAEIMMPFRKNIQKNIQKVEELNPSMILPGHGVVYKNPQFIIDAYKKWISDNVDNEALIIYISMHGSTKELVDYLSDALIEQGVYARPYNIAQSSLGEIAMDLVDAATVIFASPFVLAGVHPKIITTAYLANALRPKTKFAGIIGSFGWGGKGVEHIKNNLTNLSVELFEPVYIKGKPKPEDFKKITGLAKQIADKHKEIGILG